MSKKKEEMEVKKKKKVILVAGIIAAVVILIGVGPILAARMMKKISTTKVEAKKTTRPLLLKVTGNISVEEEGNTPWLVLTADSGKRYILIGEKTKGLALKVGRKVSVLGKVKRPQPKEVNGKPVRFIIDVTSFDAA